ncbi:sialate O-acetylesterase (plasmid) [Rufibacter tibetensis]|uniref:Sialate O-acetylesterase n=2 Tax=Rufibacter tibetensis TaxID=512763 RepID=A0A0P0CHX5_9BACT|nr:sialate O-acetylesterase [Rufibacter tibetensis]
MIRSTHVAYLVTFLLLSVANALQAGVRLPKVLTSNMVLQRGKPVPIWGWSAPGEEVTVTFGKQIKKATSNSLGRWEVVLDKMPASATPATLTVAGTNTLKLENILVGEVWLCSGQSNMEFTVGKSAKYSVAKRSAGMSEEELEKVHNPNIRVLLVRKDLYKANSLQTSWAEATFESVKDFSAPAYFFAEKLQGELNIPVGVIAAAVSGTHIERWAPGEVFKGAPDFDVQATLDQEAIGDLNQGKFYYGMIQPLAPFALRGFLWYQGETNAFQNEHFEYTDKMQGLINTWRHIWRDAEAAFYYVQVVPFQYSQSKNQFPLNEETLPRFWEAQIAALQIPNTGMIVTTDLNDSMSELHPPYKWEIGRRLALLALGKIYDKKIVHSGPVLKEMKVKGRKAKLSFEHTGSGLISENGKPLTWFTVAGADGKFVPAEAVIKKDKVFVSAPGVKKPEAVRFAWNEAAQPNFYNKEGLPARPFRTDAEVWQKKQ